MRFAYIDSQGNEVNIPSVDALRLRIELGAIVDDTVFHDSNTGRWAPASEHEIYRTLRRELHDLEAVGFAPPPPVPDPEPEPVPATPDRDSEPASATPDPASPEPLRPEPPLAGVGTDEPLLSPPVSPGFAGGAAARASAAQGVGDPAAAPETDVESAPEMEPDRGSAELPGDLGLDLDSLVPEMDGPSDSLDDWIAEDPGTPDGEETGDADDFTWGIDLELVSGFGEDATPALARDLEPPSEAEAFAPPDPESFAVGDPAAIHDAPPSEPVEETSPEAESPAEDAMPAPMEGLTTEPDLSGVWGEDAEETPLPMEPEVPEAAHGLNLEPTLAESFEGRVDPAVPEMTFETPLGPDDEEVAPDWVTQESPSEWAAVAEDDPEAELPGVLEVPEARVRSRPRSAPQQRKLRRAGTPGAGRVAVLALTAVAVGVGGWYGWNYFLGGSGGGAGTQIEVLNLPAIPPELVPEMRRVSAAAVQSIPEGLGQLPERAEIPRAPDGEWLAGRYLANASAYGSVPEYWRSILRYLSAVEGAEDGLFSEALDREIESAELSESDGELIRDRALAGWEAAASDRELVYRQLRSVATAALELHRFLLGNEDQIDYEPAAAGLSRDPVLEAVPSNEALGVAMWDRVAAITSALDSLGYLETINTEGLLGAFLETLVSTPIR
jgi:hypothetical protein